MPIDQVLVVVPAHNEAEDLPNCLRALATAASACVVPVRVVAVLDNCSDGTAGVIPDGVEVLRVEHQNVGRSRATGFSAFGADLGASAWFATTDADSVVGPTWIARQLEYARTADVVAGTVRIADWEGHPHSVRERYERMYHAHPMVDTVTSTVPTSVSAPICTGTSEDSAISKKTRMSISSGG